MPSLLQRYATPFITGLFIVSLVSGVALFFHWGSSYFHGMHEWLSMVLILPFALHLWKNWRPMTVYFAKPAFATAIVLSLLGAGAFAYQGAFASGSGGPPQFALVRALLASPADEVAAVLNVTPDALAEQLKGAGVTLADPAQPLADAAKAAGKSDMDLTLALLNVTK